MRTTVAKPKSCVRGGDFSTNVSRSPPSRTKMIGSKTWRIDWQTFLLRYLIRHNTRIVNIDWHFQLLTSLAFVAFCDVCCDVVANNVRSQTSVRIIVGWRNQCSLARDRYRASPTMSSCQVFVRWTRQKELMSFGILSLCSSSQHPISVIKFSLSPCSVIIALSPPSSGRHRDEFSLLFCCNRLSALPVQVRAKFWVYSGEEFDHIPIWKGCIGGRTFNEIGSRLWRREHGPSRTRIRESWAHTSTSISSSSHAAGTTKSRPVCEIWQRIMGFAKVSDNADF